MKRTAFIVILFVMIMVTVIIIFLRRSMPYSDRAELLSATISIDSIWSLGPATAFYDKNTEKYYWMKSLTSFGETKFDTLKSKKAKIRYMKFLEGPLENRIFRMEIDSIVVFDQIIERE